MREREEGRERQREKAVKRRRRARRIRQARKAARAAGQIIKGAARRVWRWLLRAAYYHPVMMAMPLIAVMMVLLADMVSFSDKMDRWEREYGITETAKAMGQDLQGRTPMEMYGCESMTGDYGFPWNTMSQDWSADDIEGFWYHDISAEAAADGGQLPPPFQAYTYVICKQYGVDYEMVYALIERESGCRWDACGDGGTSIGLMQVAGKWHADRMERLHRTDLENPYTNVLVGVDFLAEIQGKLEGKVPDAELPYYILAWYNYGYEGAKENLWNNGIVQYGYSEEIMQRAAQLKQEKEGGMRNAQKYS